MNPRRTKPPETVFETAAFDRSATPPRSRDGQRNRVAAAIPRCSAIAGGAGLCLKSDERTRGQATRAEACRVRRAAVASSVSAAFLVDQGGFGLAFVPHSTEDRTRMKADAEADEERDQRDDDARRAVALLP